VTSAAGALGFLDLGFSSATLRFVAADASQGRFDNAAHIVQTSLVFYGVIGCLISTIIWSVAPWAPGFFSIPQELSNEAIWAFRLAAIQVALGFVTNVYISVLKAFRRFDLSTLVIISITAISYLGAVLGVRLGLFGLLGVVALFILGNLIGLILAFTLARFVGKQVGLPLLQGRPSWKTLRRMWKYSAILSVHSLAAAFFSQAQSLILGAILGPAAVTSYQIAYTAVSKAHALVNATTEAIFPIASATLDQRSLYTIYLKTIFFACCIALSALIPITLFARPLLELWVGAAIANQAAPLVPILVLAFFFVSLSAPPFHILNGLGHPLPNVIYSAANVIIYLLALQTLIKPTTELTDFAWAYAISNVITGLVYQSLVFFFLKQRCRSLSLQHTKELSS